MPGQGCEPLPLCELPLPLCELLLPLWELLVLGAVDVVGALEELVVVVPLVVPVPFAALAIAAPPPTAAPVIANIVSRVVIRRRIWPHLLSWFGSMGRAGRSTQAVGETSEDAKNQ